MFQSIKISTFISGKVYHKMSEKEKSALPGRIVASSASHYFSHTKLLLLTKLSRPISKPTVSSLSGSVDLTSHLVRRQRAKTFF